MTERMASNLEKYYIARNKYKVYANFCIIATYSETLLDAGTNHRLLFNSLRAFVLDHPNFHSTWFRADDGSEKFFLRPLASLKFSSIVEFRPDIHEIKESFLQEVSDKYWFTLGDEHQPGWKLLILGDGRTAVFITEHSLNDGESGAQFHESLLRKINYFSDNIDSQVANAGDDYLFDREKDALSIKPYGLPSEKLIDHEPTWTHLLKTIYKELLIPKLPKFIRNRLEVQNQFRDDTKPVLPPVSRFKLLNIPSDVVRKVALKCRASEIGMTIWLATCAQNALEDIFGDKVVPSSIAINSRKFLPSPSEQFNEFGVFVCGADIYLGSIRHTKEEMIEQAQNVSREFSNEVNTNKCASSLQTVGSLKFIPSIDFYIRDKRSSPREWIVNLSNLMNRKVDRDDVEGRFFISKLIFSQGMNAVGGLVSLDAIGTKSGGLNFVTCVDPRYESALKGYEDRFKQCFSSILE